MNRNGEVSEHRVPAILGRGSVRATSRPRGTLFRVLSRSASCQGATGRPVRQFVEPCAHGHPHEEGPEIRENHEHVHGTLRTSKDRSNTIVRLARPLAVDWGGAGFDTGAT